ncbi:DEAD/DEAH box helicase [Kribbella sp. NPDC049584]|uniref:DEAD/DEAH box helicase n=1 Tax=Kribbella sp. NPDC049584 TaxID=3154833 RepID=UPI0034449471
MTQHHQQDESADGRAKKPRHKKYQNQSYGERLAANASYDAPREDRKPVKGYRSEEPRPDRGQRSYDRADERGRDDRSRDERPRYENRNRDDRPQYNRDDRPQYNRDNRNDRPAPRRDDRPQYSRDNRDNRDERPRYNRDDRPQYSRGDKPQYNRPERTDRRDDRGDRPQYRRDDKPRFDRDERPRFERSERPSYQRDDRSSYRRDDKPFVRRASQEARREEQAPREEPVVDLGTVADDNQFAALGLAPRLVQRLARDGITAPFPIQAATIPDALAGKDVLGRGQTGSGKTLGFGLPTLMRLAGGHTESRRPRGMILVPTRELAMQVHDALEPLAHVMNVSLKLIAGGLPYPKQIDALRRGVDLLIATPGRLIDLCEQGAADLGAVEVAVLDEADHMCDMGFMPAVTTLLDMTPPEGQRLLFSATLDNDVDKIVKTYLKDPVQHSTESGQASVSTMEHHLLVIEPGHKQSLTAELASRDGRTIVFVRTKLGADRIATQLRDRGVMAAALHGGLTQGVRNRTLDQFKDGSVPVLVATDVAARGIHVDDVGLVVQADPPAEHKDYLHRAGRTARAGGKGAVVTLVLPHQRRGMIRMAETAGVKAEPVRARPGDELVTELTGGTKPSGYPVKLPAPKPQRFAKGGKRFGGSSRPGRGQGGNGGPRRSGPRKSYQH